MLTASCDWLRFNILENGSDVFTYLPLPYKDGVWKKTARYNRDWVYDAGIVSIHSHDLFCWYDEPPIENTIINISGQQVRDLERIGIGWQSLLRFVVSSGYRVNRLDIAYDDLENILSMSTIASEIESYQNVVTKFRKYSIYKSNDLGKEKSLSGITVYLGNRASDSFVRFYNKASETAHRNGYDYDGEEQVRVELEFKNGTAHKVSGLIVENEFDVGFMMQLLDTKVSFRVGGRKSEPRKRPRSKWWDTAIAGMGGVGGVKTAPPKRKGGIEASVDWLIKSVAPTLSAIDAIYPSFIEDCMLGKVDTEKFDALMREHQLGSLCDIYSNSSSTCSL